MVEKDSRFVGKSAKEIKADFKRRYHWWLWLYKDYIKPEPDFMSNPKEHDRWERSHREFDDLFDRDLKKYSRLMILLPRLITTISERLDEMQRDREKKHWVESPTNAKQTLRAVKQIDEKLKERLAPIDPKHLEFDLVIEELKTARDEGGGYKSDGTYHEYSDEELAMLDNQIRVKEYSLKQGPLVVDLLGESYRKRLDDQRSKYLGLLPRHYLDRYQES